MNTLIVASIFFLLFSLILKTGLNSSSRIKESLTVRKTSYLLLIIVLLGFLSTVENSNMYGCIILGESIFSLENILLSSISISLITASLLFKNRRWKKNAIISESLFWLLKLMIFKGGYAVGFGGTPFLPIVVYDLTSISIRLLLLNLLFQSINLDFKKIMIISILIIGSKIMFFTHPPYSRLINIYSENRAVINRRNVIGEWRGTLQIISEERERVIIRNDTIGDTIIQIPIINYDVIRDTSFEFIDLNIDSTFIYFNKSESLLSTYQFDLEGENWGYISNNEANQSLLLFIEKHSEDSLFLDLTDQFYKSFNLKLGKLNKN